MRVDLAILVLSSSALPSFLKVGVDLVTRCCWVQGALEAMIAALRARRRGAQAAAMRRSTLTAREEACTAAGAA